MITLPFPPADAYRTAIEEYRFQARFNWARTHCFLGVNAGLLAVGVAVMAATGGAAAVIIFAAGLLACGLSARAVQVTHGYYRTARDRVRAIEDHLGLADPFRLDTTGGLQSPPRHLRVSATMVTYRLLAVLAAGNVAGIIVTAVR